jgi:hypothetical protein
MGLRNKIKKGEREREERMRRDERRERGERMRRE